MHDIIFFFSIKIIKNNPERGQKNFQGGTDYRKTPLTPPLYAPEYKAIALSVTEMIWLRSILMELKMNQGA
jgi:hypothetical protein